MTTTIQQTVTISASAKGAETMTTKQSLRTQFLRAASSTKVAELLQDAFDEDDREGGRFDQDGWFNFFPEDLREDADAVEEAWSAYDEYHAQLAKN